MVLCPELGEEEGKTALIDQRAVAAGKNRFHFSSFLREMREAGDPPPPRARTRTKKGYGGFYNPREGRIAMFAVTVC